jgi:hypothetical protein
MRYAPRQKQPPLGSLTFSLLGGFLNPSSNRLSALISGVLFSSSASFRVMARGCGEGVFVREDEEDGGGRRSERTPERVQGVLYGGILECER